MRKLLSLSVIISAALSLIWTLPAMADQTLQTPATGDQGSAPSVQNGAFQLK